MRHNETSRTGQRRIGVDDGGNESGVQVAGHREWDSGTTAEMVSEDS